MLTWLKGLPKCPLRGHTLPSMAVRLSPINNKTGGMVFLEDYLRDVHLEQEV